MEHKTRNTFLIAGAVLLALLIGGGIFLWNSKKTQKKLLPKFTDIRSLKVAIVYDTARITGDLGIENPLPANIRIDSTVYTIIHLGDTVGKGSRIPETVLVKNTTTYVPMQLGIDYALLQKKIKQLQDQDSTALEINLDLYFDLPLAGLTRIPVHQKLPVKVPQLPVIAIQSMKVKDFGLGEGVEMEMGLMMKNDNLEDLKISKVQYTVQAEDFLDAKETLSKTYLLPASQTKVFPVPLHLGVKEAAKAKIKKHFGDKTWNVTVKGTAQVNSTNPMLHHVDLSFSYSELIDVTKTAQGGKKEEKEEDKKGFLGKVKDKIF